MTLTNNGGVRFLMNNTDLGLEWTFRTVGTGHFIINTTGASTSEFDLTNSTGNLTIGGMLTENSSRAVKTDFEQVDPREVLSKVDSLNIPAWRYKNDPDQRHIGPMAEDFWTAFGLGDDSKHIALTDKAGVALAAIQGLHQEVKDRDDKLAQMEARTNELLNQKDQQIDELKARLDKLEKMVEQK